MSNKLSRPMLDRRVESIVNRTINSVKELRSIMRSTTAKSFEDLQSQQLNEEVGPRYGEFANTLLLEKRDRTIIVPQDMQGDPAFDMLLDLFVAQEECVDISISSLCYATMLPQSTALRWVGLLVDRDMIIRKNDIDDRRRVYLTLTPQTRLNLIRYLDRIAQRRGITLNSVID